MVITQSKAMSLVGISRMVCKLAIIAIFLVGCANVRPWTIEEKVLLGVSCLAAMADTITTCDGMDNGKSELNPIMGEYPSKSKVIVVMGISQIVTIIVSHYWESMRSWVLGAKTVANTACTFHNLRENR